MSKEVVNNKFTKDELEAAMKVLKVMLSDEKKITVKVNDENTKEDVSYMYRGKVMQRSKTSFVRQFSIALDPIVSDEIARIAKKNCVPRVAIIREAINEYLDNHVA